MGPGLLVQVGICVPIEDLFITIMWTGEGHNLPKGGGGCLTVATLLL